MQAQFSAVTQDKLVTEMQKIIIDNIDYVHAGKRWLTWMFGYNKPLSDGLYQIFQNTLLSRVNATKKIEHPDKLLIIIEETVDETLRLRDSIEHPHKNREETDFKNKHYQHKFYGHGTGQFEAKIKQALTALKSLNDGNTRLPFSTVRKINTLIEKIDNHKPKLLREHSESFPAPSSIYDDAHIDWDQP